MNPVLLPQYETPGLRFNLARCPYDALWIALIKVIEISTIAGICIIFQSITRSDKPSRLQRWSVIAGSDFPFGFNGNHVRSSRLVVGDKMPNVHDQSVSRMPSSISRIGMSSMIG